MSQNAKNEWIIYIDLIHDSFPIIPCRAIHFLGTRGEAHEYAKKEAADRKADMGAQSATWRVI